MFVCSHDPVTVLPSLWIGNRKNKGLDIASLASVLRVTPPSGLVWKGNVIQLHGNSIQSGDGQPSPSQKMTKTSPTSTPSRYQHSPPYDLPSAHHFLLLCGLCSKMKNRFKIPSALPHSFNLNPTPQVLPPRWHLPLQPVTLIGKPLTVILETPPNSCSHGIPPVLVPSRD